MLFLVHEDGTVICNDRSPLGNYNVERFEYELRHHPNLICSRDGHYGKRHPEGIIMIETS